MRPSRYAGRPTVLVLLAALSWPIAAAAQSSDPAPPPPGTVSQGPMAIQSIKSGFLAAPEFKVTDFDNRVSELVGFYAGWLTDQTFFIGGGAYFLANRDNNRELDYGGLVLAWTFNPARRVSLTAKGLVGGGHATHTITVGDYVPSFPNPFPDGRGPRGLDRLDLTRPIPPRFLNRTFLVHDNVFIAEPEANVSVKLTRQLRLAGGVGYRLSGGARGSDSAIRGTTGTVALQIGGGGE